MISFFSEDIDFTLKHKQRISLWLCTVIRRRRYKVGVINVIFCSDTYLLDINRKFLCHDYYTDIITFDYCEGPFVSGDLYISIDSVRENAYSFNQPFSRELHRVIVHGILHMVGFDDKEEYDSLLMHSQEDKCLELLSRRFWIN